MDRGADARTRSRRTRFRNKVKYDPFRGAKSEEKGEGWEEKEEGYETRTTFENVIKV